MRVEEILRKVFARCRQVHAARLVAIVAAVDALLGAGRLTLTALGRAVWGKAKRKHSIKRIDRLLGNRHLHSEVPELMSAMAETALRGVVNPIVLLDWTGIGKGLWMLSAAVPFGGRALPIYFEIHPKAQYNKRCVIRTFLHRLRDVLAAHRSPILVTDAGFQGTFFDLAEEMGWGFVGRLRGSRRRLGRRRVSIRRVFGWAGDETQDLGFWLLRHTDLEQRRLVLGPRRRPKRNRRRSSETTQHLIARRRAEEPWLLATNLWWETPQRVVEIYAMRMQIEETFRDTKNTHLGWGLDCAKSRSPERLSVLVLIGSLTTFVAVLAGFAAEENGVARSYQANTLRHRRVLSIQRIGLLALRLGDVAFRTTRQIAQALRLIRSKLRELMPPTRFCRWFEYSMPKEGSWRFPF